MRVALLGAVAWRTPPRAYGPWERVIGLLAEGLTARGVDVTVFATLDSVTLASLDGVGCARGATPTIRRWTGESGRLCTWLNALGRSAEFDLVHNHLDWLPLAFARHWLAPLLTIGHGFFRAGDRPGLHACRPDGFGVRVDLRRRPAGRNRLVLGRIHPDKGVHHAIAVARRAGRPLTIAGILHDERYFDERVAPHIDGDGYLAVYDTLVGRRRR